MTGASPLSPTTLKRASDRTKVVNAKRISGARCAIRTDNFFGGLIRFQVLQNRRFFYQPRGPLQRRKWVALKFLRQLGSRDALTSIVGQRREQECFLVQGESLWATRRSPALMVVMPFDANATGFSANNALLLARLCTAAYLDNQPARAVAQQLGLTGFIWIDLTQQFEDVYAIAAGGPGFVVIAFRGTKDFKNWMTDLQASPVSFPWLFESGPEVGAIHAGFGHALRDAWDKIAAAVDNLVPTPDVAPDMTQLPSLWLTGHSLGGALAALAGGVFSMWSGAPLRSVNGIYTFGQPRIGLYQFCGNYDHLLSRRTFRFVNNQDLVPRVPFRGWDYADVGQMIHFGSDGKPQLESSSWTNFLSRTFLSFKDFFEIAGHLQPDVGDHAMLGYEKLVESQADALNALKYQT